MLNIFLVRLILLEIRNSVRCFIRLTPLGVAESGVENFNDLSLSDSAILRDPNLHPTQYNEANVSQEGIRGQDNSMYDLIYNLVRLKLNGF